MPAIFAAARGSVAVVNSDGHGRAGTFQIQMDGSHIGKYGIVTQIEASENENFQVQHTLSDTIHVAIFGKRVGELRISGAAFMERCGSGDSSLGQYPHTIKEMVQLYQQKRLSETGKPVQIVVAGVPYTALLAGANFGLPDAETQIAQWAYRFITAMEKIG